MFVKICGLSETAHVQAAVDAGADAIGFVFAESPRRVTADRAAEISRGVPAGVRRVAVMLHPNEDEWRSVLDGFRPDVLQTDAEDFAALEVPDDIERWPVYRQGRSQPCSPTEYVYESVKSGVGETVDWSVAAELAARGRMILAGGLGVENVAAAIAAVKPFGVDVSSGVETTPGRKDAALIQAFIKAAKAAGNVL